MRKFLVNATSVVVLSFLALSLVPSASQAQVADDRSASFLPPSNGVVLPPTDLTAPVIITAPTLGQKTQPTPSPVVSPVTTPTPAVTTSVKPSIETATIEDVDPDSAGLLNVSNGGLGTTLWQETPRALIDRLLPEISLPTSSPTLNALARRMLLSTAVFPKAKNPDTPSVLSSLRVKKLVDLGRGTEAWQLIELVKPSRIDDATLLSAAEALFITDDKNICENLPILLNGRENPEWQKLLVLCQLQKGDKDAAQLSLDLLREQGVKDDIFLSLINKNILGTSKQLPRRLTPLKATTVALLRRIDLPLPSEVFNRADATVGSLLLQAKASEETARLMMAEKLAARGLISGNDLAAAYHSVAPASATEVTPKILETEVGTRAYIYQSIADEKDPLKRLDGLSRLAQTVDSAALNGAFGQLLATLAQDVPAQENATRFAPLLTRVFVATGKPDLALTWYKLARQTAASSTDIAAQLQEIWPQLVVSGLVTDAEYGQQLSGWLDGVLKDADRTRRQQIGSVLLLFSASGFSVPEEAWGRVADISVEGKRITPPSPILLERLRTSGANGHKGEAVLLSLLLLNNNEVPIFVTTDAVRALRQVGLLSDAQSLARETAANLMSSPSQ